MLSYKLGNSSKPMLTRRSKDKKLMLLPLSLSFRSGYPQISHHYQPNNRIVLKQSGSSGSSGSVIINQTGGIYHSDEVIDPSLHENLEFEPYNAQAYMNFALINAYMGQLDIPKGNIEQKVFVIEKCTFMYYNMILQFKIYGFYIHVPCILALT